MYVFKLSYTVHVHYIRAYEHTYVLVFLHRIELTGTDMDWHLVSRVFLSLPSSLPTCLLIVVQHFHFCFPPTESFHHGAAFQFDAGE